MSDFSVFLEAKIDLSVFLAAIALDQTPVLPKQQSSFNIECQSNADLLGNARAVKEPSKEADHALEDCETKVTNKVVPMEAAFRTFFLLYFIGIFGSQGLVSGMYSLSYFLLSLLSNDANSTHL